MIASERLPANAMDQANLFGQLRASGMTPTEIKRAYGVSVSTVQSRLCLLRLPVETQQAVRAGSMSVTEAHRIALTLSTPNDDARSTPDVIGNEGAADRAFAEVLAMLRTGAAMPWQCIRGAMRVAGAALGETQERLEWRIRSGLPRTDPAVKRLDCKWAQPADMSVSEHAQGVR